MASGVGTEPRAGSARRSGPRNVVREIRLTTGILAAATGMILLYALLTPNGPNRGALVVSLVAALVVQLTLVVSATPKVGHAARQGLGGLLGLLTCFGFVTIWATLDGGTTSPINAAYVVPLTIAVLRVPSAAHITVGLVVAAHLLAGYLGGSFSFPPALVWISQFGLVTITTAWIGIARAKQRRQLKALMRELEELAVRDPLTRVFNRRGFAAALASLTDDASPARPMSLMVADLDHFKRINDEHGHAAGDAVLAAAAAAIRDAVRDVDVVARTGGEEFAVALHGIGAGDAETIAERVRVAIGRCSTETPVTASIGVVSSPRLTDVEVLHRLADRAMYEAKDRGRDRVVAHHLDDAAPAAGTAAPDRRPLAS